MRKGWIGIGLIAAFVLAPMHAEAQVTMGPTVAHHGGGGDFGIGATLTASLPSFGPAFGLAVDFLWFFPDGTDVDYLEFNGNLTYDFPLANSTIVPFALAGLNLANSSNANGDSTDLGLNLGGGIEFDLGTFRPTAGLKVEIEGGDDLVLFFTLPFAIGN